MTGKLSEKIEEMYRDYMKLNEDVFLMFDICSLRLAVLIREMIRDVSGVDVHVKLNPLIGKLSPYGKYEDFGRSIILFIPKNENIIRLIKIAMHEARHAIQHMQLGDKYYDEYIKAEKEYGYEDNPFQVDARNYSQQKLPEALEWMRKRLGEKLFNELDSVYTCLRDNLFKLSESMNKIEEEYRFWRKEGHSRIVLRNIKHFMNMATEYFKVVKSCCDKMNELLKDVVTV